MLLSDIIERNYNSLRESAGEDRSWRMSWNLHRIRQNYELMQEYERREPTALSVGVHAELAHNLKRVKREIRQTPELTQAIDDRIKEIYREGMHYHHDKLLEATSHSYRLRSFNSYRTCARAYQRLEGTDEHEIQWINETMPDAKELLKQSTKRDRHARALMSDVAVRGVVYGVIRPLDNAGKWMYNTSRSIANAIEEVASQGPTLEEMRRRKETKESGNTLFRSLKWTGRDIIKAANYRLRSANWAYRGLKREVRDTMVYRKAKRAVQWWVESGRKVKNPTNTDIS